MNSVGSPRSFRGSLFLFGFLSIPTVGCWSPAGPTSGTVRFDDGTPVRSGKIEFRRTTDGSRYISRIDLDGTFHPVDADGDLGLPPGRYDVVVVQIVLTEDLAAEAHTHGGTVPRRYADYYTTDLTAEVSGDDPDPIEIRVAAET